MLGAVVVASMAIEEEVRGEAGMDEGKRESGGGEKESLCRLRGEDVVVRIMDAEEGVFLMAEFLFLEL